MNRKIILMVILAFLMGFITNYLMGGKILQENVESIKGKHITSDSIWTNSMREGWNRESGKCFDYTTKNTCNIGDCTWDEELDNCNLLKLTNDNILKAVSEFKTESSDFKSPISIDKYGPISDWDVSGVTIMTELFKDCVLFNEDISGWDVSKVTDMSKMFFDCSGFKQDISSWGEKVSGVLNMSGMFYNCKLFNQPIGNWDVSKVTDMNMMFSNCYVFNQPLGSWGEKVGSVTDMSGMFYNCRLFNQPIGNWEVYKVERMNGMFYNCYAFNQPIGRWVVSIVTDMSYMFYVCTAFNQPLGSWGEKVGNVTDMSYMFYNCTAFNKDISEWKISPTTKVTSMFENAP